MTPTDRTRIQRHRALSNLVESMEVKLRLLTDTCPTIAESISLRRYLFESVELLKWIDGEFGIVNMSNGDFELANRYDSVIQAWKEQEL